MRGVVSINGRDLRYKVIRNDVRHAYIKLKKSLQLEVVVPKKVSIDVEKLILEKKDWIEKKISEIENSLKIYKDNKVLFKGEHCDVIFKKSKENKVVHENSKFMVYYTNESDPIEVLFRWLKEEAKQELTKEVENWSKKLGIEPSNIRIKEMKTRWGSCTKRWNISINWQVIVLPKRLRDYVIVHELIHLSELNHSKRFWAKLARIFPDYRELRKELKKYAIMSL